METTINRILMLGAIIGMIVLTALFLTQKSYGSAPTGLPSTVASSTVISVGPSNAVLVSPIMGSGVATSSRNCASTVISTSGSAITIAFSNPWFNGPATSTLAQGKGIFQATTTTVVYDSGQFGCGEIWVLGQNPVGSTTVTVMETR